MNLVEMALGFQGGVADNVTGEEVQGNDSRPPHPSQLNFVTEHVGGQGRRGGRQMGQTLEDWFNLLALTLIQSRQWQMRSEICG